MNTRIVSCLALIVAISSLSYAIWLHQHTEALVQQALHQREAELVKAWMPAVKDFCEGFGIPESSIPKSPATFEELFKPLQKVNEIVPPQMNPKTTHNPKTN